MESNRDSTLTSVLKLLDISLEAGMELLALQEGKNTEIAYQLLIDLHDAFASVRNCGEALRPLLKHAYVEEMLENAEESLAEIRSAMEAGSMRRASVKTEFQLIPFIRLLSEAFYFRCAILPYPERLERYYREEFAPHYASFYASGGEKAPYKLSIAVPAYNHLDTTKQCIEQIFRETDFEKLNAELILIDHGSSDGTLAYFESLGVEKIIHFKRNDRMNVFALMAMVCQGEYFAFVSSDVLVTRNWAENLMRALESDPRVIAAVPATPNISNLQAPQVPMEDPAAFIVWANGQNRHDPARWNDRARLMPTLCMYKSAEVAKIGFADPYFYTMEFWDDDFSLRARRAGYRQILCDDTACYHFGSVTGGEAQHKENTLGNGRQLFIQKHGVDAWENGFCYDFAAVQLLQSGLGGKDGIAFLGVDCGMGDTPLQLRNLLRREKRKASISNLNFQRAYNPDLEALSDGFCFARDVEEALAQLPQTEAFECVYIGRGVAEYENLPSLLQLLHSRIKPGGIAVFYCANPFYAKTLHALRNLSVPGGRAAFADIDWVREHAEACFSSVQVYTAENKVEGTEAFAGSLYGDTEQLAEIISCLCVERYYLLCRK